MDASAGRVALRSPFVQRLRASDHLPYLPDWDANIGINCNVNRKNDRVIIRLVIEARLITSRVRKRRVTDDV